MLHLFGSHCMRSKEVREIVTNCLHANLDLFLTRRAPARGRLACTWFLVIMKVIMCVCHPLGYEKSLM